MAGLDDAPDGPTAAGRRPPRWGLVDAGVAFAIAFVAQNVAVILFFSLTDRDLADGFDDVSLANQALLQLPLWAGFLGWPLLVSRRKGNGPVEDYGLELRGDEASGGFFVGVMAQAVLVPLLYLPIFWLFDSLDSAEVSAEARELTDRATGLGVLVLVLMVVVVAPIAEEVFFRGLLMRSLQRWMPVWAAVVVSSVLFALTHFQDIQLPALVLFGLIAGILAAKTGRLGASIFAHVGFNAWTVFALLVLD